MYFNVNIVEYAIMEYVGQSVTADRGYAVLCIPVYADDSIYPMRGSKDRGGERDGGLAALRPCGHACLPSHGTQGHTHRHSQLYLLVVL